MKATGDVQVVFVFVADAPGGDLVPSSEGDLEWVEVDRVAARPVPGDLPGMLSRILDGGDVYVTRVEDESDPAPS